MLATKYAMVKGIGRSTSKINAFDAALLDAGIGDLNLVKVSSIIPTGATRVDKVDLVKGSILHIAYGVEYVESFVYDQVRAVAMVGVAIPDNFNKPGLIMEHAYIDTTWQEWDKDKERNFITDCRVMMCNLLHVGMNMRCIGSYEYDTLISIQPSDKPEDTCVTCVFAGVAIF